MEAAAKLWIGEFARRAGLNARTIRFYEHQGVLPTPQRVGAGYRAYDEGDLGRLRFVRRAKAVGLSLSEIREIVALHDGGVPPCDRVRDLLDEKLAHVREQLEALKVMERELVVLRAAAAEVTPDNSCYCGIIEHHAVNG